MEEFRNKKIFTIVIILMAIVLINFCYNVGQYGDFSSNKVGLKMFYDFNGCALFLPFYILLAFLTNNIISDNFSKYRKNKFSNFIITREGKKNRIKKEIKLIIISSIVVRLLLHLIVFIIINDHFADITFNYMKDPSYYPETFFAFSSDSLVSFAFYILYSCIGFSALSLFLYSLIDIIKNQYIYKVTGVLVSIIFVMLPAFIGNIWLANAGPRCYIQTGFLYSFYSAGLLSPGLEVLKVNSNMVTNHIYFYVSLIGFIFISFILIRITYNRSKKYG